MKKHASKYKPLLLKFRGEAISEAAFVPLTLIFTLISMVFPSSSGFTLKDFDTLDAPISPT